MNCARREATGSDTTDLINEAIFLSSFSPALQNQLSCSIDQRLKINLTLGTALVTATMATIPK